MRCFLPLTVRKMTRAQNCQGMFVDPLGVSKAGLKIFGSGQLHELWPQNGLFGGKKGFQPPQPPLGGPDQKPRGITHIGGVPNY